LARVLVQTNIHLPRKRHDSAAAQGGVGVDAATKGGGGVDIRRR
jgi:hypothetical protein